jgi:glycosyltransferase involved in cell wall biosynthesis
MRACVISYSDYDTDGRVRRYGETLVKRGYHVDAVALWRDGCPAVNSTLEGVHVYRIQGRTRDEKGKFSYLARLLRFFWRSMVLVTRLQWKERYDLVHVHSVPDFEVFAAWLPKLMGAKVILDIHDIVPELYTSKFNTTRKSLMFACLVAMERISAAFSDHVIASNHIWQKRLRERSVAESKVTAIINFPDTKVFRPQGKNRSDGRFVLLYPGTLSYHQGLDIAIRAFARISGTFPCADFHIYGSGDQTEFLKRLVAELGLESRVLFKGSRMVDQMVRVIEDSDLGVVPKRGDGFGNEAFSTKILEFMALGVPVIIPDTDIDRYYFNDSVAHFFHANDEQSLADSMALLIANSAAREKLTRNAGKFVLKYTWDGNQAIYLDLVDRLVHPALKPSASAVRNLTD